MEIVKLNTRERDGYLSRVVLGLNIFEANSVEVESDPMLIVLKALAQDYHCAAQIGWEPLSATTARTSEEYFRGDYVVITKEIDSETPIVGNHTYERIPIGIYPGEFWYADKEWEFSYWISHISADDLTSEISDYTMYDTLALYFNGCKNGMPFDPHIACPNLKGKMSFQDYWIKHSLQWFDLVCTTQYDGWYLEAYAESESKFRMLQRDIDLAVDAIKSSDWYQAHRENLYWDEGEACLKLRK